jgi:hypothetical protein
MTTPQTKKRKLRSLALYSLSNNNNNNSKKKKSKRKQEERCGLREPLLAQLDNLNILLPPVNQMIAEYLYHNIFSIHSNQRYTLKEQIQIPTHTTQRYLTVIATQHHLVVLKAMDEEVEMDMDLNQLHLPICVFELPQKRCQILPVYFNDPMALSRNIDDCFVLRSANQKSLHLYSINNQNKIDKPVPLNAGSDYSNVQCDYYMLHDKTVFRGYSGSSWRKIVKPLNGRADPLWSPDEKLWGLCPKNELVGVPNGNLRIGCYRWGLKQKRGLLMLDMAPYQNLMGKWFLGSITNEDRACTPQPAGQVHCLCSKCKTQPKSLILPPDFTFQCGLFLPEQKQVLIWRAPHFVLYTLEKISIS